MPGPGGRASWSSLFLEGEGGLLERRGQRERRGWRGAQRRVTRAVHDRVEIERRLRSDEEEAVPARGVVELVGMVEEDDLAGLERSRLPSLPGQVHGDLAPPVERDDHAEAAARGPVAQPDEVPRARPVAVRERLAVIGRLAE